MIRAFPKIFAIGQDYITDIFKGDVEVTEKIDGSQFVFGKVNGELFIRSKGARIMPEIPPKMFQAGVDYVMSIVDKLPDNTSFYTEFLSKPKHNALFYGRVPKNGMMLFGISTASDKFIDSYTVLEEEAKFLDIEVVPLLYYGGVKKAEELIAFLDTDSILGNNKVEGVVVKNYAQPFLLGSQPIPVMMGKLVSEKFKEVHQKDWKKEHRPKDRLQVYAEGFATEARWQKAVQHLRDKDELENAPRDIGKLIKEIYDDIKIEEEQAIKSWLYGNFIDQILRTAIRGFPEYYKEQLAKRSFNE